MSCNGGFDDNDPLPPGLYSQLLFGDDEISSCLEFTTTNIGTSSTSDDNNNKNGIATQKMLCFGDYDAKQEGDETTCMDSNGVGLSSLPDSRRKRNGSTLERNNVKRPKADNSTVTGHAKVVKKQKLGDRITALQQLVSPFGKTDTASVLHEALGYIRFLQDQVQALCSPYLQRQSHSSSSSSKPCPNHMENGENIKKESKGTGGDDLKSRGLCLVPVELTLHVADSNGADLWSAANHGQHSLF